jgi:hypothetical protein
MLQTAGIGSALGGDPKAVSDKPTVHELFRQPTPAYRAFV